MRLLLSDLGFQISGDWETFDANVPTSLIKMSFRFMKMIFGETLLPVDHEILEYLEENFIYSRIVCPDRRIRMKHGGVPSGSGLTALVDTIVNGYVLWRLSHDWIRLGDFEGVSLSGIRVCGDDNLQVFKFDTLGIDRRFRAAKSYVAFLRSQAKERFGMILHPDKTRVSVDPFVKFTVPIVHERVVDHSRRYLREHPRLVDGSDGWQVEVRGVRQYRIVRDPEVVSYYREHRSKRWSYLFSGAVKYLSTSYLADGTPVRPKPEVMARLASTTASIRNVCEWRALLLQYLVEFWGNEHAYHELMSMLLDSYYMERENIYSAKDALLDIELVLSGKRHYPVRDHLLANIGKDRPSSRFTSRGWWLAADQWWPNLRDPRFLLFRPQIRAIHEVLGKCKSRHGFGHDELGRLRPVLLGQKRGGSFYIPGRLKSRLVGFTDLWDVVTGQLTALESLERKVDWKGGSDSRAIAYGFLSSNGKLVGNRARYHDFGPPTLLHVPSRIIDVSCSGRFFVKEVWLTVSV
jgi:hypothetical protein